MEVSGGAGVPEKPRRRLLRSAVLCPRSSPPQPDRLPCSPALARTAFSDLENQISQRLKLSALGSVGSPGRRGVAASRNWGTELGSWPEIGSGVGGERQRTNRKLCHLCFFIMQGQ